MYTKNICRVFLYFWLLVCNLWCEIYFYDMDKIYLHILKDLGSFLSSFPYIEICRNGYISLNVTSYQELEMWLFHEMRLFMFARKHIKVFCNSQLGELATAVFVEILLACIFLTFKFHCFLLCFSIKVGIKWKKFKLYLVILYGFLSFFEI